jgi:hypothetical protein
MDTTKKAEAIVVTSEKIHISKTNVGSVYLWRTPVKIKP